MRKAYALFDFDGTLMTGDSLLLFCRYAKKQGICSGKQFRKAIWACGLYILGLATAAQSKIAALAFIKGRSMEELQRFSQQFFDDEIRPRLREKALAELSARLSQGAEILVITASPAFYLEPLKKVLEITEIVGTRMDFDSNGMATGMICGENCKGLQKPLRLAELLAAKGDRLDYDSSYAYGDSASDMPMLSLCGHKVGVNAKWNLQRKLRHADGALFVRW